MSLRSVRGFHLHRPGLGFIRYGSDTRSLLRLGWAVAASVSEWKSIHSLTLAATAELKRVEGNWHEVVRSNAPELAPGSYDRSGIVADGSVTVRRQVSRKYQRLEPAT